MSDDNKTIKPPFGGGTIIVGDPSQRGEIQRKINARAAFAIEYARAKGWIGDDETIDPTKMSMGQLLEVRAQDGWKNA